MKAFLCHYGKRFLDNCPSEFKLVVYRRYVDVIFLFKSKDYLLLFARYMNTRHKNLKFRFDFKQNNSLSFLDVKMLSSRTLIVFFLITVPKKDIVIVLPFSGQFSLSRL